MNALYDIIYIIPLSILMVVFCGTFAGMPEGTVLGYVVSAGICIWAVLLRYMKKKNRIRSIGIIAVFLITLFIVSGETQRQLFIAEYSWLGWMVCYSVVVIIVGLLMGRYIWIRRGVAALLLIYCIVGMILQWEMNKAAFALILFVVCVCIAQEIQRKWEKDGYTGMKEHIVRLSPVLIVLCIGVYLLPASSEPYGWNIVKSIYSNAVVFVNKVAGFIVRPSEEYANIGFSDEGEFSAGISDNDQEVLIVSVDDNIRNLRLIGCVSGEFDGNRWIFDIENKSNDRMLDTLETLCAIKKYDAGYQYDYIKRTKISYTNLIHNTRYIFAPSKMQVTAVLEGNPEFADRNGSIIARHRMNYADTYMVSCYFLNDDNPELFVLLNSAKPIESSEWDNIVRSERLIGEDGYTFEEYQKYRSRILDDYCDTDGVSDDVTEILAEIRDSSQGRYEMLKTLEAYLKDFEYTTASGALPSSVCDGKSYLDYFLLESRKGYCVHYATAFVLMARELGVPCRYVQGYSIQDDFTDDVTIKQSYAHAWPEAYFDNFGWVAFEPTPGYSVGSGWKVGDGNEVRGEVPGYIKDYYGTAADDLNETVESDVETEKEPVNIDIQLILIPALSAMVFLLAFCLISRIVAHKKYCRMESKDKLKYITQENMRFLGYLGFCIESGETLTEYKNRISISDAYDLSDHLGFISDYERLVYSDMEVSQQHINYAQATNKTLRGLIRKGKLRYRIYYLFRR